MNGNRMIELQQALRSENVLISFSGRFTQGIIEELGEAVKSYLENENRPKNDIFNIFAIFIEQTQNIKNYITVKEGADVYERVANSGIIVIGKRMGGTYVSSGNLIEIADAPVLAERIDRVSALDKLELKKLYKEQMKKELPPGSLGAGLGLIDIARKTSAPLEYSIIHIDERFAFFTLTAII
ncbi:hypothetical protein GTO89_06670 [Heliobacterium gestii]|uniref:Uncharacterized protein n=1 Tax=Heliomicrobium gestii TaxID=2699 RepID=A0A845L7X5_HELGE|nr:SiaB family protein kinase [Heliomicrobium gestii]MBM7865942.1 hypothetical protein [Heliomicrobium gestii]MZP42722.1 hypothetical protein [Heliomicrobium gestii]